MPPRLAVYECDCCERRVNRWANAGVRTVRSESCDGWCRKCGGACNGQLRRIAIEIRRNVEEIAAALP